MKSSRIGFKPVLERFGAGYFHMPNPKIHSPDDPNINIWGEGVGEEFQSQICL